MKEGRDGFVARFYFNCTGGQAYTGSGSKYTSNDRAGGYVAGYSSVESSWGHRKSIALFNSADIRTRLQGYRVTGCSLDYYVKDVYGFFATVYMGTHNYTAVPDIWSSSRVKPNRVYRSLTSVGQVYGMSLGTTIGTEFKDGVTTGIAFGPMPSNSDSYFYEIAPATDSRKPVLIIDAEVSNVPPTAPTLQEPISGKVLDIADQGASFKWQHNDPNNDPQVAYHFRRKKSDGTYDYWNGTAFTATDTRLALTAFPFVNGYLNIPPAKWANGTRMEWSVATEDATGFVSPWSADRPIFSSSPPSTAVVEPTIKAKVARPTIRWTFSDPNDDPQYGWAAQIVEPSVYGDPSWNPENYLRQVWSASADTTDTAVQVGKDLTNHKSYRAYVKTASSPSPPGGLQYSQWSYATFEVVIPPYAPTMVYPENGSVTDLGVGFTMEWRNNFFGNVGTQSAFAIRRIIAGGVYQWWNGTAWTDTEIYLPGTNPTYAFRPGEVLNGLTYTFSISVRDDYGEVSPYTNGTTVTASSAAQVTVSQPQGVTNISNPIVAWSMYDIENDPQQTYQVRIIHESVYNAGGVFDPGTAEAVWDSAELVGAGVRNVEIPVNLENGSAYRAYVRVMTTGIHSGWSYSAFNISLVPPGSPIATTQVIPESAAVDIIIQGRDSILSEDASRNYARWVPNENSTVVNAVPFGSAQSRFISTITSSATGTMSGRTAESWQIAPGQQYSAGISIVASLNSTPVLSYVSIEFLDANGTVVAVSSGTPTLDESAIRSVATGIAPANASQARVRVTFQSLAASNQQHGFFDPVLRAGSGGEWSPGGTIGNTFVSVREVNDDRLVRFGQNVPVPTDTQHVVIRDEEVPVGRPLQYEVTTRAVYPNAALVSPPFRPEETIWTSGLLWLSDPLRPGSGRAFQIQELAEITRPVRQGKFRPIGRADAVITTGVRGLRESNFTIIAHRRVDREAFQDIADHTEIVLLRVPPDTADPTIADPEGETIYVRFEGDAPEKRPLVSRTPHRTINQAWTEQLPPTTNFEWSPPNN